MTKLGSQDVQGRVTVENKEDILPTAARVDEMQRLTLYRSISPRQQRTICCNRSHVLYTYLSDHPEIAHSLQTRNHSKFIIPKTSDLGDWHFIIRSLYKNLYWCDLTNQTQMSIHLSPQHFIVCICVWTLYTQLHFITADIVIVI